MNQAYTLPHFQDLSVFYGFEKIYINRSMHLYVCKSEAVRLSQLEPDSICSNLVISLLKREMYVLKGAAPPVPERLDEAKGTQI